MTSSGTGTHAASASLAAATAAIGKPSPAARGIAGLDVVLHGGLPAVD